jgi:processive 1,2-diacylglycerol beta-glucosyltransferase
VEVEAAVPASALGVRGALLLTGSIGGGHDALAAGCRAALEGAGTDTCTIDVIASLGQGHAAARAADRAFRAILAVPPLYDAFHFDQLRPGGRLAASAEAAAVRRAAPVVASKIPGGHVDTVVAVFATAAGVAARLRAEGRCRRSVVFVPDAAAHRMWVHEETDLFLVTSPLGAATVRRYRPTAPVRVVPMPLRPGFEDVTTRDEARRLLGLPAAGTCVLVMGGAWGLGPLVETGLALASAGHEVLAVAGRNHVLLRRLAAAAATQERLHPIGFSDRVPELMAAADLVVTTPGMTCAEARSVGRGLVLLDVVPGHGRENLAHELEAGGAAVCDADPHAVAATVAACLSSGELAELPPGDAFAGRRDLLVALEWLGPPGQRQPATSG